MPLFRHNFLVKNKVELLLPAGGMDKLRFAIAFGADAVYAGVPMFSMRAKENSFNLGFLKEGIEYCRERGKKIYVTANIATRNFKIQPFLNAFKEMVALKPDAFIIADPGVIMLVREHFPEAKIHLSVQQNTMNWAAASFWHKQGIERIILSRELSLEEIKEICAKNPDLEIETFVHGSICMAHSGRCLISNYLTYRDANQGLCAHSCRWQWRLGAQEGNKTYFLEEERRKGDRHEVVEDEFGTHLMSSKDMCALEFLQDLVEAGVKSLKVEGRNKTVYYAAIVARAYRSALDAIYQGKVPDFAKLFAEVASVANRGFIPGFFAGDLGAKAIEYEKRVSISTHEFMGIVRKYDPKTREIELEVKNRLQKDDEVEFCFPAFAGDFTMKIPLMRFADGEETVVAHGGEQKPVFFKIPAKEAKKFQGDEIFIVVRKKLI